MFNEQFHVLYVKYGTSCAGHKDMPMSINCTKAMITQGSNHLFGVLQVSTRKASTVKLYLDKYRKTLDGILVWIRILKDKDNDGNKDVRIDTLLVKCEKPYTSKYPGGLIQYIHNLEWNLFWTRTSRGDYLTWQEEETFVNQPFQITNHRCQVLEPLLQR